MICAGLPPTTVQAGTSLVTTAPDAMTAFIANGHAGIDHRPTANPHIV